MLKCINIVQWGECKWSDEALAAAFGRDHDGPVLQHPLKVKSAYAAVAGREPPFTTCHMQGQKTVDFVLYTPAAFSSSDDAGNGSLLAFLECCDMLYQGHTYEL